MICKETTYAHNDNNITIATMTIMTIIIITNHYMIYIYNNLITMQSITVHYLIMSCSSQSKHIKHIRNNTVDIPLPSSLGRVRITSFFRRQLQPLETARMTAAGSTQEIKTTMGFRMAIYYFHSQFISLV
jgi:hypothetical protein